MRFRIVISAFLILIVSSLSGQSLSEKANKEYELFAFNRAIETYLEAVEKEGYSPESLAQLADCYRNLNQMDNARKWYDKALELGEISPGQIFKYAQVLTALQKYEEAGQWFTVFGSTNPEVGSHFVENSNYAKDRITDATAYRVSNLGLNTSSSEFSPTFWDNNLVFASARTDLQKNRSTKNWTGKANNRLFLSRGAKTGEISSPKLLHAELRNAFNEGPLSFSNDGKIVAFTKNNFNSGNRQIPSGGIQLSLFFAEISNQDWTGSTAFIHNTVGSNTGYPCFSPDGQSLYFASDRKGGFGGYDIYVSHRYEDSWSAPENLGPAVNSKGNEITPYFDGTDLTFASDWHSGFGGYDLFRAEKTNYNWDRVYHLGTGINTSYDDFGFIFDKNSNQGYLTSNRPGGKGAEDIYSVRLVSNQIVISVINEATGAPIEGASVDLKNCGLGIEKTDAAGKIRLETVEGIDCGIGVTMADFLPQNQVINTLSGKKDFRISLRKESDIVIGRVLNSQNSQPLEDVTVMVTNRNSGVTTSVNTDETGKYSLTFSEGTNYNLRYSKIGYLEINQLIRSGDKSGGLKTIKLSPVGIIPNEPVAVSTRKEVKENVETKKSAIVERKSKTVSAPAVPSESLPIKIDKELDDMISNTKEGYAIQIMSLTPGNIPMDEFKSKYGKIGDVYAREIDGNTKIRVGMYESREDAKTAQAALKAKGVDASFIVPDIHPLKLKLEEEKVKAAIAKAKAEEAEANKTKKKETPGKIYKVRLGAYKNLKWFETEKAEEIGILEQIKEGDFTIMVLTGFENRWVANQAMEKAKKIGFKDAYVFSYKNGVMQRAK